MNAIFSFVVSSKQSHSRLLDCLAPAIPYLQQDEWLSLLAGEKGRIEVDGAVVTDNIILLAGQAVSYTIYDYQEAEVDCGWSVIWSNHEIAAIHKPANLPVNRTTRNVYNTLVQLLRRDSLWPDAHLLHRLDLETSGLLLIAQNNAVARRYQPHLDQLIMRKTYRAVVYGKPNWQKKDYSCDLATLTEAEGGTAIRSQMHVVADGMGKTSRTIFQVLATTNTTNGAESKPRYSLIECEILTGRKHQIRAQLAELGHPIVGDKIYSNNGEFYLKRLDKTLSAADHQKLLTPHHLLHAYEIQLKNNRDVEGLESQEIILRDEDFPEAWQSFNFELLRIPTNSSVLV